MAFGFVAVAYYDSASSSSGACAVPTGTAANDIMFTFIKTVSTVNSVPSGWTYLADAPVGAGGGNAYLYYRVASGSEPADYTWGTAAAARLGIVCITYRDGFNTADPIDVVSDTAYITTDTILRAASMTVASANSPLIFFGALHNVTAPAFTPATVPAAFVDDVDLDNTNSRFTKEIASVVWTGSGATGDMDATVASTAVKHAFAVALKPAAGGTPDTITRYRVRVAD